ncbi:MAG: NAD(P)/FAD-dependent oxidoreductase [Lachnospiraceae bacterium]|nr:NAD(P)/FAD-dependent oxidoreductase [Lachnospiraceae bacterium]
MSNVVIVGGGAAGMMSAITAAEIGHNVTLLEQNEKLGKKIYITGKGRCNLCNACDPEDFFAHVEKNSKFMYGAYYSFDSDSVMAFFEDGGLIIKTERGNRVFPVSDHASDVTKTLEKKLKSLGVKVVLNTKVTEILQKDGIISGVKTSKETIEADSVIICTGGVSYPSTGSTGDGMNFAKKMGIDVVKTAPSLVPLVTKEEYIPNLQGLALKNVTLNVYDGKKKIFSEMGELLFTHFGISGPLGLSASCKITERLQNFETFRAEIDLKTALTEQQLKDRIIKDTEENPKKMVKSLLPKYLPGKMAEVFEEILPFDTSKNCADLSKEDRNAFISLLKAFPFEIIGTRGLNEAIITRGGINVKEINPSTMESKKIKGLFFAGEVIDVDARTGGYNLQIAWSTGRLAGFNV